MTDSHHRLGAESQGIGARVPRKEDMRHLHGKGKFVADFSMPGLLEVAFLRSPVAHAYISNIHVPNNVSNVVYTRHQIDALDIRADSTLSNYQTSTQPPLASNRVRFVGEPIALAFATTRAEAEDIIEEITVDFNELPIYSTISASDLAQNNFLHDDWTSNTFLSLSIDKNFEENAAKADKVVSRTIDLSRHCMIPLEGKAALAYWDNQADQLVLVTSTQVPHMIRTAISQFLQLNQEQVRVISPDVGGAFGYKCVLQQEELCVAWLAKTLRRPFRYVEDRREHLIAGANTREHHYEMTAYTDKKGKILALDAQITIDGGAYSVWPFTIGLEPGQAIGNLPGPYDIKGYRCTSRAVATNKPGFVPYRGVARTGVCFAIELTMNAIAEEVNREPWDVRFENLVNADQMPFVNITNKHFDSGNFPASLKRALTMLDTDHFRIKQKNYRAAGKLIGVGVATYTEQAAHGTSVFAAWGTPIIPGYDQAFVRITPDGGLEIRVGVHSHGQGMETTFAQIAHETLGIDISRVRVLHGDTGQTPFSTGTYASRSLVMSGGAVAKACKELVPRILKIGAYLLNVEIADVHLEGANVVSSCGSLTMAEIANAWYLKPQLLPLDVDIRGLETTTGYKPKSDGGCFTYATHAAVVAVDPEMGAVDILDYVCVEDCGVMVNPMVVEGQTIGGIVQGIGTALYEHSPYDDLGQPLASTLADYMIPGAPEAPNIRIEHFETPSPHTEFGAKGMGEGGAIAPPAVIIGAINDALRHMGASELLHTPITPKDIMHSIEKAQKITTSLKQHGDAS